MADRKISEMSALAAGEQATDDLITVVDIDQVAAADKNKKMTMEALFQGIPGNVGIGASSPDYKLEVADSGNTVLQATCTSSTGANNIVFDNDAGARIGLTSYGSSYSGGSWLNVGVSSQAINTTGDLGITVGSGKTIRFGVNNVEKARIDSSGRLGVGTSSPGSRLSVEANSSNTTPLVTSLGTLNGSEGAIFLRGGATAGYYYDFKRNGTTGFLEIQGNQTNFNNICLAPTSGNVGIGTTSPSSFNAEADNLVISGTGDVGLTIDATSSSNSNIYFADGPTGSEAYRGVIRYEHSSDSMQFWAAAGEAFRVDSSKRLLVGTSTSTGAPLYPTNWSSLVSSSLQVAGDGLDGSSISIQGFGTNAVSSPGLSFAKSQSGTIGSATGLVSNNARLATISFTGDDGSGFTAAASIEAYVDGTPGADDMPGRLVFSTTADGASSPTERMRITHDGFAKHTSTGSFHSTTGNYHEFLTGSPSVTLFCRNTNASGPGGIQVYYDTAQNSTTDRFYWGYDGTATRFEVRSNGGIANFQSNNANLCDEREKKNIESLDSTWGCLKNWELKKFHYNEDADTDDKRYGVIAQQVAPHCPEVITDWIKQEAKEAEIDEDGNVVTPAQEEITRMGVKEQQMMWMAIKALQEAQERIETLEAKVAALEAG